MFNRFSKMIQSEAAELAPIAIAPFVGDQDATPQVKSIYYPSQRYGSVHERSRLQQYVSEVKGTEPEESQ
jgi:hypothetical protein